MKVVKLGIGLLAVGLAPVMGDSPVIYRCVHEGAVVYSDRSCGADAVVHDHGGSRVTVYAAPPIAHRAASSPTSKAVSQKAKSARKAGVSLEQRQVQCANLDQSLRYLRAKMRSGYGVKEGERLKARHRQLTQRRRDENCG